MARRTYEYAAYATMSLALAIALVVPYWVLQAIFLSAVALVVAVESIRGAEWESRQEIDESIPRSRVTHYARVAEVEDSTGLIRTASNPFELSILGLPEWSALTAAELGQHGRSIRKKIGAEPVQSDR